MATKTITLEIDAYEKLGMAKRAGESFSEVVRRAAITEKPPSGAGLFAYLTAEASGVSEHYVDAVETAAGHDPLPDNPWA